jgi:hypothetical protein
VTSPCVPSSRPVRLGSGRRDRRDRREISAEIVAIALFPRRPLVGAALLVTVVVGAAGCATGAPQRTAVTPVEESSTPASEEPVVVAAGDIACNSNDPQFNGGEGTPTACRQKHTANLIVDADHVFTLGNAQYPTGGMRQYKAVFDATWGERLPSTHPTPGEHDYSSGNATDYFAYFGVTEYYSFDIGSWHWVSLNSEIDHGPGSPQLQWLLEDLAATDQPCIGAFWADAMFSSREGGNDLDFRPFWDALYAVRADVVLAGSSRHYERFAKQSPDGVAADDGLRQFVVGTGGHSLQPFGEVQPNSEVRAAAFGVLELRLGAGDYSWDFRSDPPGTFSDSGAMTCNK